MLGQPEDARLRAEEAFKDRRSSTASSQTGVDRGQAPAKAKGPTSAPRPTWNAWDEDSGEEPGSPPWNSRTWGTSSSRFPTWASSSSSDQSHRPAHALRAGQDRLRQRQNLLGGHCNTCRSINASTSGACDTCGYASRQYSRAASPKPAAPVPKWKQGHGPAGNVDTRQPCFWSDSWEEPSGTSPPSWSDQWSEPSPAAPAARPMPSRAAPPKTIYASPPPQKSRPQTPPKAKANTKPMPDFSITNVWGWVCTCGVISRMPTRHCEACVEPRTSSTTMLKATHWVCTACGEPNKLIRFTCLGCKGVRTARDELLRNPQPPADDSQETPAGQASSQDGSATTTSKGSTGPTPVATTSGVDAPSASTTSTRSGGKASFSGTMASTSGPASSTTTAKAAPSESNYSAFPSHGRAAFVAGIRRLCHTSDSGVHLAARFHRPPGLHWLPASGGQPPRGARARVSEEGGRDTQNPHFFALASRLMQGALTPALEWIQPEGTSPVEHTAQKP